MRFVTLLALLPLSVNAASTLDPSTHQHDHSVEEDSNISIGAMASVSVFSKGAVENEQLWRIPGALMGGHATPVGKGARVDHAALWGQYKISPKWDIQAELAAHDEGTGELSPELQHLQFNFKPHHKVLMSVGRMSSESTPSLSHHQGSVAFNEATLMADTLFGRHVHDAGVRINTQPKQYLDIGIEAWNGDFFPASEGEGAQDIYVKINKDWHDWNIKAGAWAMQSQAVSRGDDRYNNSGHSHTTATSTTPVDVLFTGDTKLNGVWADIGRRNAKGLTVGMQYEAAVSKSTGSLADSTRKAGYSNQYSSYAITPYLDYKKIQVSYRTEQLDLNNTVTGSGADIIATESNLKNSRSPKRDTVQASWRLTPSLSTSVAYTRDKTLTEKAESRMSVALQWHDVLYKR